MLVMRLILEPSLMIISIMDIPLYAKVSPLYNVLQECIVVVYSCSLLLGLSLLSRFNKQNLYLHVNYIVYKTDCTSHRGTQPVCKSFKFELFTVLRYRV